MDESVSETVWAEEGMGGEAESFVDDSVDSDDSFHSTVELIGVAPAVTCNQLYMSAMELVVKGGVKCRKIRWAWHAGTLW